MILGRALRIACLCCSLPAHGYSQLFMFLGRCGLTTPPFMQVLPTKRPSSCDTGGPYCDALCAAMMTQFSYLLSARSGLVFRKLREIVRARVAQRGAAVRAGCAYRSGSVWAMNVHGYRSSGAALCCGLIHQHQCGHPLPIVVPSALVVAEPCAWAV